MANEIGIYNPLSQDFKCQYDLDGQGPKTHTIPSKDIAYFEPKTASHIKKHLYNAIINARNLNGIELNADPAKKKKILDEINIKL